MWKTKKAELDYKLWTLRPGGPHHMGGKIQKNKSGYTLAELRLRLRKRSNKQFFYFFIPDLVQRPSAATVASKKHRLVVLQTL